ncbi:ImmA/IrrE family metallo-endopeptidase [Solirubrobacter ginsenosidimutans]|uniref:ImmA/IrrE family metallo-endopeptidase n=1 Tax=Solirubrobacter ginsenosidimutans TaxID=490573 RepID=A0A9X3N1C8_9ACTN|nr:ImmA/IrrE family metallo-endopeptidase [Solirubrobacter ginsenosidimutans]
MSGSASREAAALFDPSRLRLARELCGLRKVELARLAEVTPAAITQYEGGQNRPSPATLARLALALGQPASFFVQDGRPQMQPDAAAAFFRSLRATPQLERQRAVAWAELTWELVAVLERRVRFPKLDLPDDLHLGEHADPDAIEAAADAVRSRWAIPPGPIAHVVRLIEAHGGVIARLPGGDDRLSAFSQWIAGRPIVMLSPDRDDRARLRFDSAHELGHLVLHADPEPGNRTLERQADAFAGALLMPRDEILEELPKRWDFRTFAALKRRWGVSLAALLYRARELGRLTENSYRWAVTTLSRQYGRRKEPIHLGPVEQPKLLSRAAELAFGPHYHHALAAELHLSLETIERLVDDTGPPKPALTAEALLAEEQDNPRRPRAVAPTMPSSGSEGASPVSNPNRRHVTKRPDGQWQDKPEGATRAASVHPTQAAAEAAAKQVARNQPGGAEVVTHRPDGRIRDSDTINRRDPNPPRDTKH